MSTRMSFIEAGYLSALIRGHVATEWSTLISENDIQTPRLKKVFSDYHRWRQDHPAEDPLEFGMKHPDHHNLILDLLTGDPASVPKAAEMMADLVVERKTDAAIRGTQNLPGYDRLEALHTQLDAIRETLPTTTSDMSGSGEEFERWLRNTEDRPLLTGYPSLDGLVALELGQLVIIAGGPSSGKSSLALDLLKQFAIRGEQCEFLSLEMNLSLLRRRLIAALSGIAAEDIARRQFGERTRSRLLQANAEVDKLPLQLTSSAGWDIDRLTDRLRRSPARVFAIDYAGLIHAPGHSRTEAVTLISNAIMASTVANGKLTFLLSQINRNSDRDSRPPALFDLRDSGALEADAHVVLGLHCPHSLRANARRPVRIEVLKNRDGCAAKYFEFDFLSPVFRFEEQEHCQT